MHALIPGAWYILYVCKGCKAVQVLFADLSNGKAELNANYYITCPRCLHKDSYEGAHLDRYRHPLTLNKL